jgi:hypothetical protein
MRPHLKYISILLLTVFTVSNTGFAVYQHICYTSGDTGLSILVPNFCEMETAPSAENCCLKPETSREPADGCCEHKESFAKMDTDATIEKDQLLSFLQSKLDVQLAIFVLSNWHSNDGTNLIKAQLHPPSPHISQPKATSERLSAVQSYLC